MQSTLAECADVGVTFSAVSQMGYGCIDITGGMAVNMGADVSEMWVWTWVWM